MRVVAKPDSHGKGGEAVRPAQKKDSMLSVRCNLRGRSAVAESTNSAAACARRSATLRAMGVAGRCTLVGREADTGVLGGCKRSCDAFEASSGSLPTVEKRRCQRLDRLRGRDAFSLSSEPSMMGSGGRSFLSVKRGLDVPVSRRLLDCWMVGCCVDVLRSREKKGSARALRMGEVGVMTDAKLSDLHSSRALRDVGVCGGVVVARLMDGITVGGESRREVVV